MDSHDRATYLELGHWNWARFELSDVCEQAGRRYLIIFDDDGRGPHAELDDGGLIWVVIGDVDDQKFLYVENDIVRFFRRQTLIDRLSE